MAHYSGLDVLDQRVTLRRIHVLLHRLPPGSWPNQDRPLAWTVEAYLLAGLFDAVQMLTFVTLKASGSKSVRQPRPLPRPKAAPVRARNREGETRKRSGWADLADLLKGQKGVEVIDVG